MKFDWIQTPGEFGRYVKVAYVEPGDHVYYGSYKPDPKGGLGFWSVTVDMYEPDGDVLPVINGGFGWGWMGAGPRNTACAVLAAHFGEPINWNWLCLSNQSKAYVMAAWFRDQVFGTSIGQHDNWRLTTADINWYVQKFEMEFPQKFATLRH